MMRPTPLGVALFALSLPVAVVAVAWWPEHWYVSLYLPCAALTMMLADCCMTLPGRRLTMAVSAPPRLYIGQQGTVKLRLDCAGRKAATKVQAVLEISGEVEKPLPGTAEFRDGALELELPVRPIRRGIPTVTGVQMRWRGPIGLVERLVRRACVLKIEVVPNIQGLHDEALRFFSEDNTYGVKHQRMRGEGTEFDKLCEYSQGMDNRFIDWKRSARHRRLLAKEFRQERNHQIIVGIDTGHLMLEPLDGVPRLDHAIRAGLTLGWVSLRGGDLVGGCGFDARFRSFIQPGRGMPYFTQLQRFCAGMEYHTEETNFTLGLAELNTRLKRRGLVVLFSEFVDSISAELLLESLQLLTRKHLVIFVTISDPSLRGMADAPPDSFHRAAMAVTADDFLRERAVVLERVARLGVHCLDVPVSRLAPAVLNRYLFIKQKGLL